MKKTLFYTLISASMLLTAPGVQAGGFSIQVDPGFYGYYNSRPHYGGMYQGYGYSRPRPFCTVPRYNYGYYPGYSPRYQQGYQRGFYDGYYQGTQPTYRYRFNRFDRFNRFNRLR
jgi:hypothetical protein